MTARTVTTQAELDAALADTSVDSVTIDSPRGVWLTITGNGVGSASVEAYGSASVEASGSASVRASGSASVRAYGSASVRASPYVAVHLHSARATVIGGVIIDVSTLDLTDPATWCAYHGVAVTDGIATVYKAVSDTWTTDRGADYSPGATPEATDWRDDHDCGGGLHFCPRPAQSRDYYPSATRYVAVGVALDDMRPIPGGTPKCKSPRVVVACREVTIDGDEVRP